MTFPADILDLALAVRRGQRTIGEVPAEVRPRVRAALQNDRALITHARARATTPLRTRYQDAPVRSTRAS